MAETKKLLRALAGETLDTPPIWMMRQAGRYLPEYRATRAQAGDFLSLCYNSELAAEVTLQPIRRYGFDAAILFSDILVVPDALGQKVEFVEGEGPKLEPVRNGAEAAKLSGNWMHQRLEPVYEAVGRIRGALPHDVALIGFAGAPWTVATYMVEGGSSKDFAHIKSFAYGDPEGFQEMINLVADNTADYLAAQVESGAETVQIFDSWAGVLPDDQFRRWIIEPTKRLVARFRASHPDVPVIGFPRGAGLMYPEYIEATGVTAVGLDTTMPLAWARDNLQTRCPVQGNLDPQILLAGGDALDAAVDRIVETLGEGAFVFNLGHGIVKETPPENVERLMNRLRGRT